MTKERGEKMETKDGEDTPHKCTACGCEYTDDEGGVQCDFGIMYMSFCPTCLSCIFDMVEQLTYPREELTRKLLMIKAIQAENSILRVKINKLKEEDDDDGRC